MLESCVCGEGRSVHFITLLHVGKREVQPLTRGTIRHNSLVDVVVVVIIACVCVLEVGSIVTFQRATPQ